MTCSHERVQPILDLFTQAEAYSFGPNQVKNDLCIAVSASIDFHDSLIKWGESPPVRTENDHGPNRVDYVVGTIRSGIEWFLNVRNLYRGLDTSGNSHIFKWSISTEYQEIREAYLRIFPELTAIDLKLSERLDCLLTLCQIQLVFLAANFRSEITYRRTRGPLDPEKVRRQFDEVMDMVRERNRLRRVSDT